MVRKSLTLTVALAIVVTLLTAYALAATQTFTGTVTDEMCGKKHMMAGHSDAECIRACVKGGSKYALQTDDKLYVLKGNDKQVDALAGKKAKVTGTLNGNVVTVASISEAK